MDEEIIVKNRELTLNEVLVQMIEKECNTAEITHTVGEWEVQLVLNIIQFKKGDEILYKDSEEGDKDENSSQGNV